MYNFAVVARWLATTPAELTEGAVRIILYHQGG